MIEENNNMVLKGLTKLISRDIENMKNTGIYKVKILSSTGIIVKDGAGWELVENKKIVYTVLEGKPHQIFQLFDSIKKTDPKLYEETLKNFLAIRHIDTDNASILIKCGLNTVVLFFCVSGYEHVDLSYFIGSMHTYYDMSIIPKKLPEINILDSLKLIKEYKTVSLVDDLASSKIKLDFDKLTIENVELKKNSSILLKTLKSFNQSGLAQSALGGVITAGIIASIRLCVDGYILYPTLPGHIQTFRTLSNPFKKLLGM